MPAVDQEIGLETKYKPIAMSIINFHASDSEFDIKCLNYWMVHIWKGLV